MNADTVKIVCGDWDVTAYRRGNLWKVIAISPDRHRVIHRDKVTDPASFDLRSELGLVAPVLRDFASELD